GLCGAVRHALIVPAGIVAAALGVAFVQVRRGRALAAFLVVGVATAAAWIAVITAIMPLVESQRPMKPLALSLRATLAPGDRIVGDRISILASLIYYTDHQVRWVDDPASL